ncbi:MULTISPECIES: hypothetical protein [unclassified Rhizobium]|uniref:hypothetical protein n=1 Tax=unclassified Rhizobium TaxID=2613769 RepID=UPI001617E479|nr:MULTISPECIES: hypothetical protein [unclassified Rhizobium]MBB3320071.1 hypothetical protein [Rhizobium sp. BK181]MBB3545327.1 hypothetical protein [Rhizobium sp. BK399]MCS4096068.1 hypothetical protein [Rhizobium sp. BK176]
METRKSGASDAASPFQAAGENDLVWGICRFKMAHKNFFNSGQPDLLNDEIVETISVLPGDFHSLDEGF